MTEQTNRHQHLHPQTTPIDTPVICGLPGALSRSDGTVRRHRRHHRHGARAQVTATQFSDDPYWEGLFCRSDAIAVVNYNARGGLPRYGHMYVLIKRTEDGQAVWYQCEYTPDEKRLIGEAEVRIKRFVKSPSAAQRASGMYGSMAELIASLSSPVEYTEGLFAPYRTGGVQYVPLTGDFSESLSQALTYYEQGFGSLYTFVRNNCLRFFKDIMRAGVADNPQVETFLETGGYIVPAIYGDKLRSQLKGRR